MKILIAISFWMIALSGCMNWQEPVPEYAIRDCLEAQGRPVYNGTNSRTEFTCEFDRNLDSRWFNDSRLLDPNFKTGDVDK